MNATLFRVSVLTVLTLALPPKVSPAVPSPADSVHYCVPFDYEQWRRENPNPAAKRAADLNVGEPRTVRMIYFLPNDRAYRADVVRNMKLSIRNIQDFYAEEIQTHGYGDRTFRIETDAQDEPIVHRVDGQHPDSHYLDNTPRNVFGEINRKFDLGANNVYLVVIDNSIGRIGIGGGRRAQGIGSGGRNGGFALVSDEFRWRREGAHELGHTFGLQHDFNNNGYIMSYGEQPDRLSACHAEFLAVHPYFNTEDKNTPPPTIELVSPQEYPAGSESVSIQLKVTDSDGLHQTILFATTSVTAGVVSAALGGLEVKACRKSDGEKDAVIEFNYDGDIPSGRGSSLWNPYTHPMQVRAVDIFGNVSSKNLNLSCENCPLKLVKILGDSQQGATRTELAMPLVVEVRDKDGIVLEGAQVTFTVTAGNGKLGGSFTVQNVMTNAEGKAQSTFTLGPNPGTNTVEVTLPGVEPESFNAVGIGTPPPPSTASDYQTWSLPDGAISRLGKGQSLFGASRAVAFSPDGQRLAVLNSIGIWLYDVATSRELALLTAGQSFFLSSMAFSPDGTLIALGSGEYSKPEGLVLLYDVSTGRNVATLDGYGRVSSIVFSSDSKTLIVGSRDGTVRLWDVATRTNTATFEHGKHLTSVALSPDRSTLAVSLGYFYENGIVELWDVATRTNFATLEGHTKGVNDLTFSPDGTTLASGSEDNTVKLWDVAAGRSIATLQGHRSRIYSVTFSPEGNTLASGAWPEVKLWDISTKRNIATLPEPDDVYSVAFSPDGTTLASVIDGGMVKLWDISSQNSTALFEDKDLMDFPIAVFSPDGETLVSGGSNIKLWDTESGENIATLQGPGHIGYAWSLAISPDGTTLAAGFFDATINLWNLKTRQYTTSLKGHVRNDVWSLAFSPDGATLVSGARDETIRLWNVATGRNIATLDGHVTNGSAQDFSVVFSPDGSMLASGGQDNKVKLWDIATKRNIATLEHGEWILSVAFSPDGSMLASGSRTLGHHSDEGTLKLWDVAARTSIARLEHTIWVNSVTFSPDGSMLASGGQDNKIKLWDVATKRNIVTLEGHKGSVRSVTFSPDGKTLASGSVDGTILLWDMTPYVTPQSPAADFDNDGTVGFSDFLQFAAKFGLSRGDAGYDPRFDLDGDGTVGFSDFLIFAGSFGHGS